MTGNKLTSFRLKNFKAVRDSGTVEFGPLTVFIGNNGSGKSSLIEGLETYQNIILHDFDYAMRQWSGFENVRNQHTTHDLHKYVGGESLQQNPIKFELRQTIEKKVFRTQLAMTFDKTENLIAQEKLFIGKPLVMERTYSGDVFIYINKQKIAFPVNIPHKSLISFAKDLVASASGFSQHFGELNPASHDDAGKMLNQWYGYLQTNQFRHDSEWQFVKLEPAAMSKTIKLQRRTGGKVYLDIDGSNLSEYLLEIRQEAPDVFEGILKAIQSILPYADDLQPTLTSELMRAVYLQLTEGDAKIPGWLLSTGTLRVIALLALLRHPEPPPLIVIEEIENGLDPRTIHILIEEIRSVVKAGTSQVIITTHSPYLLDLVLLEHIVLVERDASGQPIFHRPADDKALASWAEKFAPGKLYTMGKLNKFA